jgi:hypothetical protein
MFVRVSYERNRMHNVEVRYDTLLPNFSGLKEQFEVLNSTLYCMALGLMGATQTVWKAIGGSIRNSVYEA